MARSLPASFVHYRPRNYGGPGDKVQLGRNDWSSMQQILGASREQMDTVSKRDVFAGLGRYMTTHPPSTSCERQLTQTVDVYNLVHGIGEREALVLAGCVEEEEEEAATSDTAPRVPSSSSTAAGGSAPSRKPPHIVYKEQQKRLREQQEREKKLARLKEKEKRMKETVEGLTAAIVAKKAAAFAEEQKRNRSQLEMVQAQVSALLQEQEELEKQAARGQATVDEDLITCCITQAPMKDPVTTPDGMFTFEREAIEAWLAHNAINPCTREPLDPAQLKSNAVLKSVCDRYWAHVDIDEKADYE